MTSFAPRSILRQRRIPTAALIADDYAAFTRGLLAKDGALDIYVNQGGGSYQLLDGDSQSSEVITAQPISRRVNLLIEDHILALNGLLKNLELRLISTPESADVRLIATDIIPNVVDADGVIGLSQSNLGVDRKDWELFINARQVGQDSLYEGYAFLHELGHVFGLEHPFDNSDRDLAGSRSPWQSFYPDETVMAYREPRGGLGWSPSYRRNDLLALSNLWGLEFGARLPLDSLSGSVLRGRDVDDVLIGSPAADRLLGLGGDDLLIDGSGADSLNGGLGFNRYRCTSDGQRDQVIIQIDGKVDVVTSLGREDRLLLPGVRGGQFRFALTAVELPNTNQGTLAGIGVWVRDQLEVLVADPDRQLEQVQAQTYALGG